MKSLLSSVNQIGKEVTEIIHFKSGHEKTFEKVLTETIKVGSFTKFKTSDGKMVAINQSEVEWFEVHNL
jgi:hypothetical protein